jgi:Flp pilus assembly protein TadG
MKNIIKLNSSMINQCCKTAGVGRRAKLGHEAGQAVIEMMILLPIFLVLMIGTVEFGRLAYAYIEVADAARAGVQYGAQNRATASDNTGMQQAAINDAQDVHGMTAVATHSCACANGAASTCRSTDCAGSRLIEWVQVNTSAQVDPVFRFPGIPPAGKNFVLKGQAVMRVGQ